MHYKVASKREREREYAWKRIRLVESTRNGGEKERALKLFRLENFSRKGGIERGGDTIASRRSPILVNT